MIPSAIGERNKDEAALEEDWDLVGTSVRSSLRRRTLRCLYSVAAKDVRDFKVTTRVLRA